MASPRQLQTRARTVARRQLAQALYQMQLTGQSWQDIHGQFAAEPAFAAADAGFFKDALAGISASLAELDADLAEFGQIPPPQLDPIEHGILWLGLWELRCRPEVPYSTVIDEGVKLTHAFGAAEGHRFVNAVLDAASRVHRAPERGAA